MSQRSELEKDAIRSGWRNRWEAHTAMMCSILSGEKGTAAQRAAIHRILNQLMEQEDKSLSLVQNIRSALKTKEKLPI